MPLARNIAIVGGATLVSRVLGFARDAGIAALFGSSPFAQAFFAVMQFINFFRRLLAEGAINGAFAPIWLRLASEGRGNRFARRVLLMTSLATFALAVVGLLLSPFIVDAIAPGFERSLQNLALLYLFYALPYVAFAGPVAVIAAALNAEGKVAAVAVATVTFNLVLLTALILAFEAFPHDSVLAGVWLCLAIVLAGIVQLVIVVAAWFWKGRRFAPESRSRGNDVGRFFARAAPALIASGIPQLKLLVGAAVASASQAGLSWLYYANRLYELPLGVASVTTAIVIVPLIAASVHTGKKRKIAAAQSRAFEIALGLTLPAATAFAVLAVPIAGGLFERGLFQPKDTAAVALALAAISAGLPGHALEKVLGAVSFAHEDTATPMLAALCGLAAAVAGALLLFPLYGHAGVAGAIAISGWIGAAILALILLQRGQLRLEPQTFVRVPRIILATAAMAIVLYVAQALLWPPLAATQGGRIGALAILVALGLAVYGAAVELFGVARLSQLAAELRKRL